MRLLSRGIRLSLLVLAISAVLLIAGCKKPSAKQSGNPMDFTLKNFNGTTLGSAELRGKIVLLEFWATWCPPCKMAIPEITALNEKTKGTDIAIVTISVDESYETAANFIKDYGMTYTVLHDDGKLSKAYEVRSVPTTIILDKTGKVVTTHLGYMPGYADAMLEELKKLQ